MADPYKVMAAYQNGKLPPKKEEDSFDAAQKSVRNEEADFAIGALKGILGAVGSTPVEFINAYNASPYGDKKNQIDTFSNEWFKAHLVGQSTQAQKTGYEMGNVLGWLSDPGIGMAAVGGARKVETLDEMVARQLSDLKRDIAKGGTDPSSPLVSRIKKFAEETFGIKWDDVIPSKPGEWQSRAFPASENKIEFNQFGEPVTVSSSTAYTQTETNPLARSGAAPPEYSPYGNMLEDTSAFAARRTPGWTKGWNPDQSKAYVQSVMQAKAKKLAKGKTGGSPEFWVYDEAEKKLYVVKRTKDGTLFIGKPKGRGAKIVIGKNPDGSPIYSSKVDMVMASGARDWIHETVQGIGQPVIPGPHNLWPEVRLGETSLPPAPDVVPPSGKGGNLYDQGEGVLWDNLTPTEKRDFREQWAQDVLEEIKK